MSPLERRTGDVQMASSLNPAAPNLWRLPQAETLAAGGVRDRRGFADLGGLERGERYGGECFRKAVPGDHTGRHAGFALMIEARRLGLDLSGWDADWTGARLFIAGIDSERDASLEVL